MENKDLKLAKTYDNCVSGKPRLTVALIHGIASDSSTYRDALEYWSQDARLRDVRFVTFDLLGSGQSPSSDELNYDYAEQVEALHWSIEKLELDTPLVLVGHSLGTFIVARYTATYPDTVKRLILLSPPIYTEADFENPAFMLGVDMFKKAIYAKDPHILQTKAFNNSMANIVLERSNYQTLAGLRTPTVIIYGNDDQIIASYNVPQILKDNAEVRAIRTVGRHGVKDDKYTVVAIILEEMLDAENL